MSIIAQDASSTVENRSLTLRGSVGPFLSREQILAAAGECFAQAGYDGTTIRAIAGKLDCSVGSIYRYFADKRQLLLALAERAMRPVLENLEDGGSFEQSRQRYIELAAGNGELYRLQFWLAADGLPPVIEQIITRWSELLASADEAQRQWAMLHGLLMLQAAGSGETLPQPPIATSRWGGDDPAEDMTLL